MYSEDPRLSSALTYGYVSGIQGVGDGTEPTGAGGVKLAAACCKHLAAYDVETNRMTSDADINTRSMWEHYLPVFHSCLIEAEAMHSMCSCKCIQRPSHFCCIESYISLRFYSLFCLYNMKTVAHRQCNQPRPDLCGSELDEQRAPEAVGVERLDCVGL